MTSDDPIKTFVRSFLEFRPDVHLKLFSASDAGRNGIHLAATGKRRLHSGLVKLGTLHAPQKGILARVFVQPQDECFYVYLISEGSELPPFTILTAVNSFQYFLVNQEGRVRIPKASGIDPLKDALNLSYPIETVRVPSLPADLDTPFRIRVSKGSDIRCDFTANTRELRIHVRDTNRESTGKMHKLMLIRMHGDNPPGILGLVVIRNGLATLTIPETDGNDLVLSFYT